ncbi:hypothetical protein [Streptomyces sp. NPDC003952]
MKTLLNALKPYRKAIVSGLIAAVFAAIPLVTDGDITGPEVGLIVSAGLAGAGVTYRVPNSPSGTGTGTRTGTK